MPEIKNEVPADQELEMYLDERLKGSSFSLLIDYPGNQTHYPPKVAEALFYLSSYQHGAQFLATIKNSLFQSLQRLNQLPRTDPFWYNTNLRPTVFKLGQFCERVLYTEPADILSLLTLSAMTIFQTSQFERGCWLRLYALNALPPEMILFAAMLLEVGGADDSSEFSEFVHATGTGTVLRPLLEEVVAHGGELLSKWSRSVMASLSKC